MKQHVRCSQLTRTSSEWDLYNQTYTLVSPKPRDELKLLILQLCYQIHSRTLQSAARELVLSSSVHFSCFLSFIPFVYSTGKTQLFILYCQLVFFLILLLSIAFSFLSCLTSPSFTRSWQVHLQNNNTSNVSSISPRYTV